MARRGDGLYEAKNGSWKLDCWIHGQRVRKSFGRIPEKLARDLATAEGAAILRGQTRILPPGAPGRDLASGLCHRAPGPGGGRVWRVTSRDGGHGRGERRRKAFMLAILWSRRGARPESPRACTSSGCC